MSPKIVSPKIDISKTVLELAAERTSGILPGYGEPPIKIESYAGRTPDQAGFSFTSRRPNVGAVFIAHVGVMCPGDYRVVALAARMRQDEAEGRWIFTWVGLI